MADEPNLLGEYVRARRELVTPEQAGIPVFGVRRVPGLRREEVALLAGISADYYLRLEQGRDRNPSVQVLEAIARVLRLDDTATAHLLRLGADGPRRHRARPHRRKETVPPSITKLLATLPLPAMVEGRYFDVLAANPSRPPCHRASRRAPTACGPSSSIPPSRRSIRSGRSPAEASSPRSARPSAPTPTTPVHRAGR